MITNTKQQINFFFHNHKSKTQSQFLSFGTSLLKSFGVFDLNIFYVENLNNFEKLYNSIDLWIQQEVPK